MLRRAPRTLWRDVSALLCKELPQERQGVGIVFEAVGAQTWNKPLRADERCIGARKILFHSKSFEARKSLFGRVGVKCGKDDVPCVGGLDECLRGLAVAGFAYEDVVGILTEKRTQSLREGELFAHLHLGDAIKRVLHGIFERENGVDACVDACERAH